MGRVTGVAVAPKAFRKTYETPRRPYEKERLDQELKLVGEYGLRCKREVSLLFLFRSLPRPAGSYIRRW